MQNSPELPDISEEDPDAERMHLLHAVAQDAAGYLQLDPDTTPPKTIVEAVNNCIRNIQKGKPAPFPEDEEADLLLGCLWAEQVIKTFGWQWVNVTFHDHDDTKAVGVVSPDRSMAIYPFHFVYGCLENGVIPTVLLSYNMLLESDRVPDYPARSYVNIMDHIRHIVPPD